MKAHSVQEGQRVVARSVQELRRPSLLGFAASYLQ